MGLNNLIYPDNLSLLMIFLIIFIVAIIAPFAIKSLEGKIYKTRFVLYLTIFAASNITMISANHILLIAISYLIGNLSLALLTITNREWRASYESSILILRNFILGFISLSLALLIIYNSSGEIYIQKISDSNIGKYPLLISSLLILLSSITQSSILPFHKWLASSQCAVTPVSAIINGPAISSGIFLMSRFAKIFINNPLVMNSIFIIGILSSIFGAIWMFMQSSIKNKLSFSTMSQTGFSFALCGLGLFPAAICHTFLHSLFKSYLFLSSASRAQKESFHRKHPPKTNYILISLVCGVAASCVFSIVTQNSIIPKDTSFFLMIAIFMSSIQFSLLLLQSSSSKITGVAIIFSSTISIAAIYGLNLYIFDKIIKPLKILAPMTLSPMHIFAIIIIFTIWPAIILLSNLKINQYPKLLLKLYVVMLNASQPNPKTVTTYHNYYRY